MAVNDDFTATAASPAPPVPGAAPADFVPADPLVPAAYQLTALGRLQRIWDDYTGRGIHIGIYDSGVELTHPDLAAQLDLSRAVQLGGVTYDGAAKGDSHGTAVAGLIAAANNGIGAVGVAFGASITSVNVFDPDSPIYLNADDYSPFVAIVAEANRFDIMNNSWGFTEPFAHVQFFDPAATLSARTVAAYEVLAATGRGALGTIIVQSAGNDAYDAGVDPVQGTRANITVAALASAGVAANYSNHGPSVLVAAPGGAVDARLETTDLTGAAGYNNSPDRQAPSDYTNRFSGTSASAPLVSGVVALMLQANPGLGWRDVQNILASSARLTGSALGGTAPAAEENGVWSLNHADAWNGGGMHVHTNYGYGAIDAYAAVRMAEAWSLFAPAQVSANEATYTLGFSPQAALGDAATTSFDLLAATGITIEHIDLRLIIRHAAFTQLRVALVSPEGSRVQVLDGSAGSDDVATDAVGGLDWTYGIDQLRGETAQGSWRLEITDNAAGGTGSLVSGELRVFGRAPTADSVWHYTDELGALADGPGGAGRLALTDLDGGIDWIDAAAAADPAIIALAGGAAQIAGRSVTIAPGIENVVSGDGADRLSGTAGANRLHGMRGDDTLEGLVGDDWLFGGAGADSLDGGTGADYLDGGAGADITRGGPGDDTFMIDDAGDLAIENPGEGADTAWVSAATGFHLGPEIEIGRLAGVGTEIDASGVANAVQLVGNGVLRSRLTGGTGDDVLWGGAAFLSITADGGPGDDVVRANGATGTFIGGDGNDQFVINRTDTVVREEAGPLSGIDTAWVTIDGWTCGANVEIIRLAGLATFVQGGPTGTQICANPLFGSTLIADRGNDVLWGSPFADSLDGGAGDDIFRGQGGADEMSGETGNDQYVVLDPGVRIIERPGDGYDTAWIGLTANIDFTLAAEVERGNLSGAANRLTGNAGDNVLVGDAVASWLRGDAGDDLLFGSPFADVLEGGAGNDIIYGYGGADHFVYGYRLWGSDQISRFDAGARLDFRGSGLKFDQLDILSAGGNTRVGFEDNAILVFGATLARGDFLFDGPVELLTPIADQTAIAQQGFTFTLDAATFFDPHGAALGLQAVRADGGALPAWLGFDTALARFSGTPGLGDLGDIDIRLTATDDLASSASDVFRLHVTNLNQPPIVASPIADADVTAGFLQRLTIGPGTFADPEGGALILAAGLANGGPLPAWLSFGPGFGGQILQGTPPLDLIGQDLALRVVVSDAAGASVADDFVWHVRQAMEIPPIVTLLTARASLASYATRDTILVEAQVDTRYGGTLKVDWRGDGSSVDEAFMQPEQVTEAQFTRELSFGAADRVYFTFTDARGNLAEDVLVLSRATVAFDPLVAAGDDHVNVTIGAISAANNLQGGGGGDLLRGGAGRDTLSGGAGDDELEGGQGNDVLAGGEGTDLFLYWAADSEADEISDFTPGQDRIVFRAQGFAGGVSAGDSPVLVSGTAAQGGGPQFIFDAFSHLLAYDADGEGGYAAVQLAWLAGVMALSPTDVVIA